ncbi:hypothetical protein ACIOGZ_08275 [Kitasatospora sp. NPDC088160]|uniref:hypothetical protein n=1 Tax=Kitasatospora sp. NPDC088160 TaxID=3364072 RepID=UPI0037F30535
MNGTEVEIAKLRAGDRVEATTYDAGGRTITRTGVLLAKPRLVVVQVWGHRVKKWRLHIDAPGSEIARANAVALWPHQRVRRLDAPTDSDQNA